MTESIRGAELLTAVFGRWPSFHDAEVLRLTLDRAAGADGCCGPTLTAEIYAFELTNEVAADGAYVLQNQVVVTFRFLEVAELRLEGLDRQNMLWDLYIRDIRERQEVSLAPGGGIGASFLCNEIEIVTVRPWQREQVKRADA